MNIRRPQLGDPEMKGYLTILGCIAAVCLAIVAFWAIGEFM
ncbi:MAG: hypothetical protein ACOX8X_01640 [Methanomethylophilus sp.]|jgi:hypothetical protein